MTVEEIFNKLAAHMVEGIMIHDELSQGYDFLGFEGFSLCHNNHHIEETHGYMRLCHYYSCHYHKLINLNTIPQPNIIPPNWRKYTTMEVDTTTKREAVKTMMTKWVEWERDTKKLYQEMYKELYELNEIAAANQINCYILDVTKELTHAEKKLIKLETTNYDIGMILSWQEPMKEKYEKKLGW